jgi:chlorophyll synthase
MAVPQLVVIVLLLAWDRPLQAGIVTVLLALQGWMMLRFMRAPVERALWYSGFGVPLYVSGMMTAAVAVRDLGLGA